nr:maestro heat-like repeat-containing protein family member 7 isoform X2 [Equus asinus]
MSTKHLEPALDELQVYSALLTDKDSSSILKLMKEHQQREWGLICNTIYLSYGKIILESEGAVKHLDAILALVLQHYCNCIVEKGMNLKLDYLNALTKLTNILSSQPLAFQFKFPQKLEIVTFMVELIKEEPLNSISSPIRQKAMNIITDFRNLRPLLEVEGRAELLSTCYKSVFCLPAVEALQKEASSPKEAQANVELFRETLQSLRRLLETLVVEKPTWTWYWLELLDTWLNSQKDNERERAMWCTACILGFTAKMNNFERREGRNRVCGKKRARAKSRVPTCSTTTSVRLPRLRKLWRASWNGSTCRWSPARRRRPYVLTGRHQHPHGRAHAAQQAPALG